MYGTTSADRSSGLSATNPFHRAVSRAPINGMRSTQTGGDGSVNVEIDLTRSAISPAWPIIVRTASDRGMRTVSRIANVMMVTASPRLPLSFASSLTIAGQVAITINDAQTMETRKGSRIQKLAAISIPMKMTARVVWVTSRVMDDFAFMRIPPYRT